MAEKIARHYVPSKNPEGAMFPGVPLRDLTEAEWADIPDAIQKDVDASPLYRKTPVQSTQPVIPSTPQPQPPIVAPPLSDAGGGA